MPTYFAHGFRWRRTGFTGIRVHVILNDLDDVSPEYIQNATSQGALLESFRTGFPDIMKDLDGSEGCRLQFLEQYDPDDETSDNAVSQPWAFVCDAVKILPATDTNDDTESRLGSLGKRGPNAAGGHAQNAVNSPALSYNVSELIAAGPGSTAKAWEALADLRDKIAEGEKIDWWVVYNGDPERVFDSIDDMTEDNSTIGPPDEEVCIEHGAIRKTFVPVDEGVKRSPLPTSMAQPRHESKLRRSEMPPPDTLPMREKGKASPRFGVEKSLPPDPPAPKISSKAQGLKKKPSIPELIFKKKLFSKKN